MLHCVTKPSHWPASSPPSLPTLALIKRSLNASFDNGFDEQLELERDLQRLAGRSEDYREGVSAFINKRTPAFKGR